MSYKNKSLGPIIIQRDEQQITESWIKNLSKEEISQMMKFVRHLNLSIYHARRLIHRRNEKFGEEAASNLCSHTWGKLSRMLKNLLQIFRRNLKICHFLFKNLSIFWREIFQSMR